MDPAKQAIVEGFLAKKAEKQAELAAKQQNKPKSAPRPRVKQEPARQEQAQQQHAFDRGDFRAQMRGSRSGFTKKETASEQEPARLQGFALQTRKKAVIDYLIKLEGKEVDFRDVQPVQPDAKPGTATAPYDLSADEELLLELRATDTIRMNGTRIRYVSGLNIANSFQLLNYIKNRRDGAFVDDFKDAYLKAVDDAEELRSEGKLYGIFNIGSADGRKPQLVYHHADETPVPDVDPTVVEMFRRTPVPGDLPDLQRELRAAKLVSATEMVDKRRMEEDDRSEKSAAAAKKQRKARAWNKDKVTNKHLPGLFEAAKTANMSIDIAPNSTC